MLRVETVKFNDRIQYAFPEVKGSSILIDLVFFKYRYFKFVLDPVTGQFRPQYAWVDPEWNSVQAVMATKGEGHESKMIIFDQNQINIIQKSDFELLTDEVMHPFMVFQICSIILWSLDDYYYYAACIFTISLISIGSTFLETRRNVARMKELAQYSCDIHAWRNNRWVVISSETLVPGDVIELGTTMTGILPCDSVLISGEVIVNESLLTGESLPVTKIPIPDQELSTLDLDTEEPASSAHMSKYFLFSGTKLIRVRGQSGNTKIEEESSSGALALVVRTGFNTTKGSLIRSMLFPRPNTFKFYRDSFRFIGVLAIISALGFLVSLYNFLKMNIKWTVILMRALDLITIAVPPALPATMAIGTSFAISRLRQKFIFCTSPPRVNIGGKINLMCFDKTGTLTEEGLDVLGLEFTVSSTAKDDVQFELPLGKLRFSRLYKTVESLLPLPSTLPSAETVGEDLEIIGGGRIRPDSPVKLFSGVSVFESKAPGNPNEELDYPYPLIVCAMACCHSIKVVGEDRELIGDPLDLKMFAFTDWTINEEQGPNIAMKTLMSVRPPWVPSTDAVLLGSTDTTETQVELAVVRSLEFSTKLRRMSVIAIRNRYSTNQPSMPDIIARDYEVYVKGAPEAIRNICKQESIPNAFDDNSYAYTRKGLRLIAIAHKVVRNVTFDQVMKLSRSEVESDLTFLGFIVFENKLKEGTTRAIRTLNTACIRQIMITGDNILTSISVSRECSLVHPRQKIFGPKFIKGMSHEEDAEILWQDLDGPLTLDPVTFKVKNIN